MPASGEQLVSAASVGEPTTAHVRIELAQHTLRQFGFLRIRATGGSMLPAIAPGDLLDFRRCRGNDLAPGQVVFVTRDGRLVAHRLVERTRTLVITRGDALAAPDPAVAPGDIMGVLVGQRRGRRTLHAGGRPWLRRQRAVRWLIRRVDLAHRLLCRIPALASLAT